MGEWIPYNKLQVMWQLMKLGPEWSFEIRAGKESPWDFQMRSVRKELVSGSGLGSNWDEYLLQAIYQKGRAYVQYKDKSFQIAYDPANSLRLVPSFDIVGRYVPPKRRSTKKRVKTDQKGSGIFFYKFGPVVTADIAGLALYLFGDVNSYTIGQAYAWNNQNEYTPLEVLGGEWQFNLSDFTAAGKHYNIKGKVQGVVFYHRGVGFLNGLSELHKNFPNATSKDVRALYSRFGIEPSSQIGRFFKKGELTSPTRPKRRVKPIEGLDLVQYIGKNHIKKDRKSGELLIFSQTLGQEIVANTPFEIVQIIRENGQNIEAKQGLKIWEEIQGVPWIPQEEGDD